MRLSCLLPLLTFLLAVLPKPSLASGCDLWAEDNDFPNTRFTEILKENDLVFMGEVKTIRDGKIPSQSIATFDVLERFKGPLSDHVEIAFPRERNPNFIETKYTVGERAIVVAKRYREGFSPDPCADDVINRHYKGAIPEPFITYSARVRRLKEMVSASKESEAILELLPLFEQFHDRLELEDTYTKILDQKINGADVDEIKVKRAQIRFELGEYQEAIDDLSNVDRLAGRRAGVDQYGLRIKCLIRLGQSDSINKKQNGPGADLSHENLQKVVWTNSLFEGANFDHARLNDADLSNSQLLHASFREAELSGANLKGAKAYRADFTRAYLKDANLESADLQGANFSGATLDGANLKNAKYDSETYWPANFDPGTAIAKDCTIRDLTHPACR